MFFSGLGFGLVIKVRIYKNRVKYIKSFITVIYLYKKKHGLNLQQFLCGTVGKELRTQKPKCMVQTMEWTTGWLTYM